MTEEQLAQALEIRGRIVLLQIAVSDFEKSPFIAFQREYNSGYNCYINIDNMSCSTDIQELNEETVKYITGITLKLRTVIINHLKLEIQKAELEFQMLQ